MESCIYLYVYSMSPLFIDAKLVTKYYGIYFEANFISTFKFLHAQLLWSNPICIIYFCLFLESLVSRNLNLLWKCKIWWPDSILFYQIKRKIIHIFVLTRLLGIKLKKSNIDWKLFSVLNIMKSVILWIFYTPFYIICILCNFVSLNFP